MTFAIGNSIKLRQYIEQCIKDPDNRSWMVFNDGDISYKLEMLLFPVSLDNWDIEPEEYGKIENEVLSLGYSNCLQSTQIVDIVTNLMSQKNHYTDDDLERALDYYSDKDTFITI